MTDMSIMATEVTFFTELLLTPPETADLQALDYAYGPLGAVPWEAIYLPQEPVGHMARLEHSILQEGFQEPALVFQRSGSPKRILVEGHHRGAVALRHNLSFPVALHLCACPLESLDYFGLCKGFTDYCSERREALRGSVWSY